MAVRTELSAGTRLASYTISSVLGRGAMSVVYEAEDARLGRRVALKVLAPSMGERESFRERFLRESRIAASIDHPNVIPIYEAGEADGLVFIAMRRVAGTDLRGLLAREGPLAPARALDIVTQAANGLDAAHSRGLLHRDVKPGNILLASDEGSGEHVYISDFGLAVSGDAEGMLDGGGFNGTAEYAAPEQIEGHPEARSDVYSLACVLYECLTGEPPFGSRRPLATLWAHLHEQPPLLSERCRDCPQEADAVLAAAHAKDPDDRPATPGELASTARAAFGVDRTASPWRWRLVALAAAVAAAAVAAILAVGLREDSPRPAAGPTIATFAGTGVRGSAGDGGPARAAELAAPIVAAGPRGELYILQSDRPALRRVDGDGVISTVVGTGEAGTLADRPRTVSDALCGSPFGFAFDSTGAVYVSCHNAHRVIRVEPDGSFLTVAGTGEAGFSGDGGLARTAALNRPAGIAFDSVDNLYIAEAGNHRVRRVDRAGTITTFAGTGRAEVSGDGFRASFVALWSPIEVAVDGRDNVYILEDGLHRVRKVDRRGFMTTVAGSGRRGFSGDGGDAAEAELDGPLGIAVDAAGNLYIADRNNQRVRKVTAG